MVMAHDHHHHHHHGVGGVATRRALGCSLLLTVAFGVGQVVAGIAFDSLALLADAVHNVSDGAAIGLALGAAWLAGLPPRGARTFGWRRVEILAALVNGLTLIIVGAWILWEAWGRFDAPPEPTGLGVIAVGAAGLIANGIPVVLLLRTAHRDDLNARGALLHLVGDVVGSLGVVLAGAIVALTGWYAADPLIAAAIGLMIIASSFKLLREALRILLEIAPPGLEVDVIGRAMAASDGVREVHDLHVWTVTSGFAALSAHVIVRAGADHDRVLHDLQSLLRGRFDLRHVTLQIDREYSPTLLPVHRLGCEQAAPRTAPVEH